MSFKPLKLEDIPVQNVGKYVLDCMQKHGDKEALVDGDTDATLTYKQLKDRTERAASGLQGFGVNADDVVCIMSPNSMDYVVASYAVTLIYAVLQPINPLYTKEDLQRAMKECNTKYVLTVPALVPKLVEALVDKDSVKIITFGECEGYTSFELLINSGDGVYVVPNRDPKTATAALLSSSGTTGFPKAVIITHYCLIASSLQQMSVGISTSEETFVMFFPLFHIFGLLIMTYTSHLIGHKLVLMSRFKPDDYLNLIQKYKPRMLHVVPPVMVMFAKYPKVAEYDLSSVEYILCGAAPLSKEVEDLVRSKLNLKDVYQGYGMTEAGVTHVNAPGHSKYKSVGKILPLVKIKIVDVETDQILETGKEGEILVKGPQVCNGYLNRTEENSTLFTSDGWARTGDIGYEDEEGFLFVVDRLKELIKYKAFQVAPAALEDILLKNDNVADAGVVGMPDEDAGELPRAYVVLKPGRTTTEQELMDFVEEHVAPHMKLRGGVKFVSEIPRSLSGKILRKTLREDARQDALKLQGSQ